MQQGFMYDDNYDLKIEDGKLAIDIDDNQNMEVIAMNDTGQFFWQLYFGVGFLKLVNASYAAIEAAINKLNYQLKLDGFKNIKITSDGVNIEIDGNR